MNFKKLPLFFLVSLTAQASLDAAIPWAGTPNAAYTAGSPLIFTADPAINSTSPAFTGIQVTATVDQPGTNFFANGSAGGQLCFRNTNPLEMGDSITFDFQFNMQLFSGVRPFSVPGTTRAAALFHIAPTGGVAVDGTGVVTSSGGISPLATSFGTPPAVGALTHTNPNVLSFNDPGDLSIAVATNRASFASVAGNTATFTEGSDTSRFIVALTDPQRSSADFSFDRLTFTYTNDSATAIPSGSHFIFTLAGQNPDAQEATLVVPEPSRALLFFVGGLLPLLRRRR